MATASIEPQLDMNVNTEALAKRAQAVAITSSEERQRACEMLEGVIDLKAEIQNHYEPIREKAWETYQAVLKAKKEKLEPVLAVENALRAKIGQYDLELKRKQLADEEELRRHALEAERKKREQEAAEAREQGKEILATAIESAPIVAPPIVVPRTVEAPTSTGAKVQPRVEYEFRITNPNLVPREYCVPDEKAIRAVVKARKGNIQIPGVEVYEVADVTVRRKREA